MKHHQSVRLSMAAIALSLLPLSGAFAALEAGKKVPNIVTDTASGKSINLHEMEGIKVLEWTNHDCPFVKKHYSSNNMQSLQTYAKDHKIHWISVVSSAEGKQGHISPEQAAKLSKKRNASPEYVVLDASGAIGKSYGAKTTPHMYVIAADNTLSYMGAIDDNRSADPKDVEGAKNYVRLAMDAALAGKTPETQVTTSYGCSVKY